MAFLSINLLHFCFHVSLEILQDPRISATKATNEQSDSRTLQPQQKKIGEVGGEAAA